MANVSQKILRRPAVQTMTGLTTSTLYRLIRNGQFPRPVRLGPQAVGWRIEEVTEWISGRERAA